MKMVGQSCSSSSGPSCVAVNVKNVLTSPPGVPEIVKPAGG